MTEGRADVEILGQRLSVRGRGTPEYIHELADYLNGRIQAVREQARVFDPLRLSLLAGLHVVDELYRCRETTGVRKADVDAGGAGRPAGRAPGGRPGGPLEDLTGTEARRPIMGPGQSLPCAVRDVRRRLRAY